MSRLIKYPVTIPQNVEVSQQGQTIKIKGTLGEHHWQIAEAVQVSIRDNEIYVKKNNKKDPKGCVAGTERKLIKNMIEGVTQGFQKTLQLVGVGYRARVKDKHVELTVGYSHPIQYEIPEDVTIETPSQTEIVVKGISKQRVGQVASEIRSIRSPEPYKGKGIRYNNERVVQKEGKKK